MANEGKNVRGLTKVEDYYRRILNALKKIKNI
jgi:hypothetical protein